MLNNQPSRLALEVEEFYTLPTEELIRKRVEFQNIRLIIKNELKTGAVEEKGRTWEIKAQAAYDINGLKISAIDSIIGERNANLYKDFYKAAHQVLPEIVLADIKDKIRENNKEMLALRK